MERMEQPKRRSPLRSRLGSLWYGGLRRLLWIKMAPSFTRERSGEELPWGQTEPAFRYEAVEREAEMRGEYWGGYTRHNRLVRQVFSREGELLWEEQVAENHAIMMYSPFLEGK